MQSAYSKLEKIFQKIGDIEAASAILSWDSATFMPKNSAPSRAEQLSTLSAIKHNLVTSNELADLLEVANESELDDWQARNLQLMRHRQKHAKALDEEFVRNFSKAASECENIWRSARGENNFKLYASYLKQVIEFVRESAAKKSQIFVCSPYDALLDQYDAGRKSAEIDEIFSDLGKFLPNFISEVMEHQKTLDKIVPLKPPFKVEAQKALGLKLMKALGFDFDKGRLDTSLHPFCGGTPDDIRITTRYDEQDFTSAMMGVLHETGHALYESGLPKKWRNQPVGEALGMSIHESQSLLVEMQVCRSYEFLKYAAPLVIEAFGNHPALEIENLHRIYTNVKPDLIRVDADEVTYPAHVILRYNIEKAIIAEEIEVDDIPEIWNQGMKDLLGVNVPNDKMGCMQDIHWADGSLGYFPTYSLGAMSAAQFFAAAKKDNPEIMPAIEKGDFKPLVNWLNKNIHRKGSRLTAQELLINVTGEGLNVAIYKAHLRDRYLG